MELFKDNFNNGASLSMEVDNSEQELYVFDCPAGQGCNVSKWPLDPYHMAIALDHYNSKSDQYAKG